MEEQSQQRPGSLPPLMEQNHPASFDQLPRDSHVEKRSSSTFFKPLLFGVSFTCVLIINCPANVQNCNLGHLEKREIIFSRKKKRHKQNYWGNCREEREEANKIKLPVLLIITRSISKKSKNSGKKRASHSILNLLTNTKR